MYEFVVDKSKGVVTLGGHTIERLAGFQINANDPTKPLEVILRVVVDLVEMNYGFTE